MDIFSLIFHFLDNDEDTDKDLLDEDDSYQKWIKLIYTNFSAKLWIAE